MAKQIAVLVGSNSKTSFNQIVAKYLKAIAPTSIQLNFLEIADLPLYNRDLDDNSPAQYVRFRKQISEADGILFVSPEHNGSTPAVLKNAVDIGSRPSGESLWIDKPAGIVTVTATDGADVTASLKALVTAHYVNMKLLPNVAQVPGIFGGIFNEQGEIASEDVKANLQKFIKDFADFVQ
ncbi:MULTISPECIES: NADPH-dependent FMN reductase [unclassified Lonepinella]|uniref:NADPH-dependent FMN reductase n=1 Tax=unclassified Lonepinella TaxID=2642006 RepID=UPI0036DBEE72